MWESITVAVRVRPLLHNEGSARCVTVSKNQVRVGSGHCFVFDRVFDETATSDDVYVALGQPLADSFLSGFHAAMIAYGQTGSGKTFTMTALLSDVAQEIFCRITEDAGEAKANEGTTAALTNSSVAPRTKRIFSMTLSVLEVYNECIGDLLAPPMLKPTSTLMLPSARGSDDVAVLAPTRGQELCSDHDLPREKRLWKRRASAPPRPLPRASLTLREDPHGGVNVVGLTEAPVRNETELLALIDGALGNRRTASTGMNARSSRSHCVVTLTLQRRGLCSRCSFVDLAGSERLKKSIGLEGLSDRAGGPTGAADASLMPNGAAAVRIREGISINSGLLALGNVIVALCEKKSHVPYRSSKLTRMLQPMLGGNARTGIIACISQHASSLEETLNTLKYAGRAKYIHNSPHLSVAPATTLLDAQQTILLLREQLEDVQRRLVAALAIERGPQHSKQPPHVDALLSPPDASTQEVQRLRELLLQERQVTRRLEKDVFDAEYTAMMEAERRRVLEAQVEQLKAASTCDDGDTRRATQSLCHTNHPVIGPVRPQDMREGQEMLAAMQVEQERYVTRSGTVWVGKAHRGAVNLVSSSSANVDDGSVVARRGEETAVEDRQFARLQQEKDRVSARFAQCEEELHHALSHEADLCAELLRADPRLTKSEITVKLTEKDSEKVRAIEERPRRAKRRAEDNRRRLKEGPQRMRERQADVSVTPHFRERAEPREEVPRQGPEARGRRRASLESTVAQPQEIVQLKEQLQWATSGINMFQRRSFGKDATVATVRKQFDHQQPRMLSPVPSVRQMPEKAPPPTSSSLPTQVAQLAPALDGTPPRVSMGRKRSQTSESPSPPCTDGICISVNGSPKSSRNGNTRPVTRDGAK